MLPHHLIAGVAQALYTPARLDCFAVLQHTVSLVAYVTPLPAVAVVLKQLAACWLPLLHLDIATENVLCVSIKHALCQSSAWMLVPP